MKGTANEKLSRSGWYVDFFLGCSYSEEVEKIEIEIINLIDSGENEEDSQVVEISLLSDADSSTVRWAGWNIRIYSDGSRNDNELLSIANVLIDYDFFAIVELRDERALGRTEKILMGMGRDYDYIISKPVGKKVKEPSTFLKNLLKGEAVNLRFGNEERGKYGKLLAYVYRAPDGIFVNLEIVRQGNGHAYTRFPFKHMEIFREYENEARQIGKGLWAGESSKPTSTATKFSESTTKPTSQSASKSNVNGNMTVYVTKSGKKYHRESWRWGNRATTSAKAREIYSPCNKCNPPK